MVTATARGRVGSGQAPAQPPKAIPCGLSVGGQGPTTAGRLPLVDRGLPPCFALRHIAHAPASGSDADLRAGAWSLWLRLHQDRDGLVIVVRNDDAGASPGRQCPVNCLAIVGAPHLAIAPRDVEERVGGRWAPNLRLRVQLCDRPADKGGNVKNNASRTHRAIGVPKVKKQ
jgi:hypothetical protein